MSRNNDGFENAYSNSDSAYFSDRRRGQEQYGNSDLSGTRVFGAARPNVRADTRRSQGQPRPGTRQTRHTNLVSVNVSLTIIIVALTVCLVILLALYMHYGFALGA